jgi:uncharacterized protein (TIGR02678 family)
MSEHDVEPSRVDVAEQKVPGERADMTPTRRKRWHPEASAETASALRRLAVSPWLIAGRDDETIGAVRRNLPAIREALARLGWVLVAERDFVRLRKSPPVRRHASSAGPTPLQASWFFLIVAAAESLPPRVALPQLVIAARAAASEAGLSVTHDIAERRAIVHALRMLDDRGVVMQVDGDVDGFIDDEEARVLLAIHHSRLVHVIANFGPADPTTEPVLWLEQVEREPDAARRMRRRLIDDTVVHVADLDDAEADWLSRRVRGDDGGPLATAFGLHLERRAEGAAFVVPDEAFRYLHELGRTPFPAPGTVPHAALLLGDRVAVAGIPGSNDHGPGSGWCGLHEPRVIDYVASLAAERMDGKGGWRRELTEDSARLVQEIRALLCGLDLVRVVIDPDGDPVWWFSPAIARWSSPHPETRSEPIPGEPVRDHSES